VSALVGFELFVRPAVLALQGAADPGPDWERGRLAENVRANPGRDELVRARALVDDDGTKLEPLAGRESHMIARAAGANALVLVPRGAGELVTSTTVRYLRLG
jgi:molybdopterin molybdotransferase